MVDLFTDGQITHLLSLLSGGRKRPFAVEMLAGIQSSHPQLMVKRHPNADRDEVHIGMLEHFVRVGKSVGNSELLSRFVCGFLAARADRRDLELTKRAQGRNVGIAPPAVAHTCSNDANTDLFCCHDVFFHPLRLIKQAVAACLLNEPDRLRSLGLLPSGDDNIRGLFGWTACSWTRSLGGGTF